MTSCLWLACILIAIIGSIYAVLAAFLVARFAHQPKPILGQAENVTLLKPLYGAEPGLAANLRSFCVQDYTAAVQMICGVQDTSDPAIAVVRNLKGQFPSRDVELVVDARRSGGNPKIANILNMFPRTSHDLVILSDSDMRVANQYVHTVVAALQQPQVGLVTCLYRGCAITGFWSRLAAAAVDQHFLPSVLVGVQFASRSRALGRRLRSAEKHLSESEDSMPSLILWPTTMRWEMRSGGSGSRSRLRRSPSDIRFRKPRSVSYSRTSFAGPERYVSSIPSVMSGR